MPHTVEERPPHDPELTALLDAAFAELVAKYGAEGRSQVKDGARYFVVVDDARHAVACAALQTFDNNDAELKRMYVAPHARGRGLARLLLNTLEQAARAAGHSTVRLSTGYLQPEAIALYESSGYTRTEPWGKYVFEPSTYCYSKQIALF
ncbi:GNAT family N-acetyltransferase [Kribbella jejuensis]|uniref:N-acetylglutamate synthase-like GNAT family acetyltransferase n=1 Tax=Kribbella jejuensis TaxID=236068 RepID=A0A542EWP5_9ACTN|nr:GNAT family N-acetyltransferase [Kribbella jejuensis]TQJ19772.1 N-acetylglutamate synthase-like GNAT family acetyltransferase [Kribbella jejuensis]